jgi:hypothetical protein
LFCQRDLKHGLNPKPNRQLHRLRLTGRQPEKNQKKGEQPFQFPPAELESPVVPSRGGKVFFAKVVKDFLPWVFAAPRRALLGTSTLHCQAQSVLTGRFIQYFLGCPGPQHCCNPRLKDHPAAIGTVVSALLRIGSLPFSPPGDLLGWRTNSGHRVFAINSLDKDRVFPINPLGKEHSAFTPENIWELTLPSQPAFELFHKSWSPAFELGSIPSGKNSQEGEEELPTRRKKF